MAANKSTSSQASRLVCLMFAVVLTASVVSALADPEPSLHSMKEGWNWGKKVGGKAHNAEAHGYGEVHADPKVGHSWVHGLEVKDTHGHGHGHGHKHGHGYGSGYVKVVKLVRRNENNHGGHGRH